ncbi:MAG: hypothetical protein QHJ81_13555 [Anaerolineae bacterium]|nr:hypothetical protein [Anaerolineae bacterium]
MAQATKMGADSATLEARRRMGTGHTCIRCGSEITQGELLMVRVVAMETNGRPRNRKVPYHRKCYGLL